MSTRRYLPASGTACLARSLVRGNSRVPSPPPMMMARVFSVGIWKFIAWRSSPSSPNRRRRASGAAPEKPSPKRRHPAPDLSAENHARSTYFLRRHTSAGSLRRGGTAVFVGLPGDQYVQLSIFAIVGNNTKIIGSTLGNRVDLAETFQLHAAGKTKVITEAHKLDQVNEAFEEVERGKAKARLVFDFR